jgi:serine/threonine-protein kinase
LLKVLDFGISKLMEADTTSLSLTSGVLGSPLYMSPEQLNSSKQIDYRCDIWSLGTILYELITGKAAFQADGLPQVCTRVMLGSPDRIGDTVSVPAGLEAAILTCLSKTPEGRHPSVADLAAALMPFARGSSQRSAEAAIRIIRASSIAHGDLPHAVDSVPPPPPNGGDSRLDGSTDLSGPPSSVVRELNRADISDDRTVNISAPPAGITQQELKPLVSPTAMQALPQKQSQAPRALLLGGLALIITFATLLGLRLGRSQAGSPATPASVPLTPSVETTAEASPPALPQPAPAAAQPSADSAPSAPPLVSAPSPARPATAARKPQPIPRPRPHVEPDSDELLRHR